MSSWFDDVMPPGAPEGEAEVESVPRRPQGRRPEVAEGRVRMPVERHPRHGLVDPGLRPDRGGPVRRPVEPSGDGGFFDTGDVAAGPMDGQPGDSFPGDELTASEVPEGPGLEGYAPEGDAPEGHATLEATAGDDGGFFSAETDPFDVPVMAGIERAPHQERRDKVYDTMDKVGDTLNNVGGLLGGAALVAGHPEVGVVIGASGSGVKLVSEFGRMVGNDLDRHADAADARMAKKSRDAINKMKDQAAQDRIDRRTPRGSLKPTKD